MNERAGAAGCRALAARICAACGLAFVLLFGGPARAAGRAECRTLPSRILRRPVAYCVLLPPGYDAQPFRRYPVLYFFHGLGEDEQTLLRLGGWDLIQDLWDQKRIGKFVIAAPAADRSFYIDSRDGRVRYQDFLVREFFPFIERHYRIRPGRRFRGVTGVSMGGYGALRLAFLYPGMFGSVSAHSPALIENVPRLEIHGSQWSVFEDALGTAFGVPFDRAFWNRNSPFTLARTLPRPAGVRIYFDCGLQDDFGFNTGAEAFHRLLLARDIPHEFHLYPGGHNWSYFAQHFPASLEFHSQAFGYRP